MSVMGVKIDQLDFPLCNSFRPKILNDQLCYTVDPNKYKDRIDLKDDRSLTLFIDYNEDREYGKIKEDTEEHSVIIETIGSKIARLL